MFSSYSTLASSPGLPFPSPRRPGDEANSTPTKTTYVSVLYLKLILVAAYLFVVDSVDFSSKDSFHTIGFAQMASYSIYLTYLVAKIN